ncbi:MAG TPA: NAD(+)/NADH kinase [Blastocatellia bacterium]|nr:NAD(+)/NADH kinase [Blastocatellia bacterium]
MHIKSCILVLKQTILDRGGRAAELARQGDATARRILSSDAEQQHTIDVVQKTLSKHRIPFTAFSARDFSAAEKRQINAADLVITIGGDGTALGTSHYIRNGAMLGVNSAPGDSVGHFCHTHRGNFAERLADILAGRWQPTKLARLAVTLDDKLLPEPALNDVLIAHDCPAATTRYLIELNGVSEEQRSSGIWVATAAGSTAGIKSAGGKRMPLGSERLQYLVRELYREPQRSYALTHGFLAPHETLIVASKMQDAHIYIDGARTAYEFPFGARLRLQRAAHPLRLFIAARASRPQ